MQRLTPLAQNLGPTGRRLCGSTKGYWGEEREQEKCSA